MKLATAILVAFTCAAVTTFTLAADIPLSFEDPAKQARYQRLIEELRCAVCQNQSIADSHADLAQDMRNEVYRMVESGRSDDEVIEFLVARYGDFVRYRPAIRLDTALLWGAPAVLALCAVVIVVRLSRTSELPAQPLSTTEQERLAALTSDSLNNKTDSESGNTRE